MSLNPLSLFESSQVLLENSRLLSSREKNSQVTKNNQDAPKEMELNIDKEIEFIRQATLKEQQEKKGSNLFTLPANKQNTIKLSEENWEIKKLKEKHVKELTEYIIKENEKNHKITSSFYKQGEIFYNKIYSKISNSSPPLPNTYIELCLTYIIHLVKNKSQKEFVNENLLRMYQLKLKNIMSFTKIITEIENLQKKLFQYVNKHDETIIKNQNQFLAEAIKLKKKQHLIEKIEEKKGGIKREYFLSIYTLAKDNKYESLKTLIENNKKRLDQIASMRNEVIKKLIDDFNSQNPFETKISYGDENFSYTISIQNEDSIIQNNSTMNKSLSFSMMSSIPYVTSSSHHTISTPFHGETYTNPKQLSSLKSSNHFNSSIISKHSLESNGSASNSQVFKQNLTLQQEIDKIKNDDLYMFDLHKQYFPVKVSKYSLKKQELKDSILDLNALDPEFGLSALHYAVQNSSLKCLKILLKNGANVNIYDSEGRTPLHLAASYGSRVKAQRCDIYENDDFLDSGNADESSILPDITLGKLVTLELIAYGADLFALDSYQRIPLDLAIKFNNQDIADLLRKSSFQNVEYDNEDGKDLTLKSTNNALNTMKNTLNGEIPDEFHIVDSYVYDNMSLPLRLLTKRLNNSNPFLSLTNSSQILNQKLDLPELSYLKDIDAESIFQRSIGSFESFHSETLSKGQDLEFNSTTYQFPPFAQTFLNSTIINNLNSPEEYIREIRLCSKHYILCIKEKFYKEASKSLKRRWFIAKMFMDNKNKYEKQSNDQKDMINYDLSESTSMLINVNQDSLSEHDKEGKLELLKFNELEESKKKEEEKKRKEEMLNKTISLEKLAADFNNPGRHITYLQDYTQYVDNNIDSSEEDLNSITLEKLNKKKDLAEDLEKSSELVENLFFSSIINDIESQKVSVDEFLTENIEFSSDDELYEENGEENYLNKEDKNNNELELLKNDKRYKKLFFSLTNLLDKNFLKKYQKNFNQNFEKNSNTVSLNETLLFVNNNYLIQLGFELGEYLLYNKNYVTSLGILTECLKYSKLSLKFNSPSFSVSLSLRISILTQYCELILFLYDTWNIEDIIEELRVLPAEKFGNEDIKEKKLYLDYIKLLKNNHRLKEFIHNHFFNIYKQFFESEIPISTSSAIVPYNTNDLSEFSISSSYFSQLNIESKDNLYLLFICLINSKKIYSLSKLSIKFFSFTKQELDPSLVIESIFEPLSLVTSLQFMSRIYERLSFYYDSLDLMSRAAITSYRIFSYLYESSKFNNEGKFSDNTMLLLNEDPYKLYPLIENMDKCLNFILEVISFFFFPYYFNFFKYNFLL